MTVKPYIVTAYQRHQPTIRIPVLAADPASAITTVQYLYPSHLITSTSIAPEWEDTSA
jgi:hypothetical protein